MFGDLNDAIAKNNTEIGSCNIHKFSLVGDFNAVDRRHRITVYRDNFNAIKKTSIVKNFLPGHFNFGKKILH